MMKKTITKAAVTVLIVAASLVIPSVVQAEPVVELAFTYPAGESPGIFSQGWVFGAKCIVNPGRPDERDISDTVEWGGTGLFAPPKGALTKSYFGKAGKHTIKISVNVEDMIYEKKINVNVVEMYTKGNKSIYASTGDFAACEACAHGCPACPHPVKGPILTGSPTIFIGELPAARKGDTGVHAVSACCGSNNFKIEEGDPNVLIDGQPAARVGDKTEHCGGIGKIVTAKYVHSPLVAPKDIMEWIFFEEDLPAEVSITRKRGGMNSGPKKPSAMVEFMGKGQNNKNYYGYAELEMNLINSKAAERYNSTVRTLSDRIISKDIGLGQRSLQYGSKARKGDPNLTVQQIKVYWNVWTLKIGVSNYIDAQAYSDQQMGDILKELGKKVFDRLLIALEGIR